jgi:polyadenylate-binding protein
MNTNTTPYTSASLYVGDLHPEITEAILFDVFNAVGPVASIRVCRDAQTRQSLGYAYVNYHNSVDAERALDTMNYTPIKGRPCRIMWCHRDPSIRKSGTGNVFIKNLDKSIDNKTLYDTFSAFGNILSCKVVTDDSSASRGYGFVHYETAESADNAIQKVNNMLLVGKKVFVGRFVPKKEREAVEGVREVKFTNVYVKNLDTNIDENKLNGLFAPYGKTTNIIVMRDNDGTSKGFGFINFEKPEEAKNAVEEMNGKVIENKPFYVGRAQKKAERETELKHKFEQLKLDRLGKYQGVNLYVKNLDDTIDDDKLREAFVVFGGITSAKVMKDDKENSKGFGFVCYQSPDEATKAVTEMNGRMIGTKPIYVALAQRKDVRRAQLEAQHRQNGMRLQQAGAAGMGPGQFITPVFYPNVPPQRQGFVYPQQMVQRRWVAPQPPQPGRPGAYQMANYNVPGVNRNQRGQNRQRNMGSQRNGGNQSLNGANNRRNIKFTHNARNRDQGQQLGHVPITPGTTPLTEPLTASTLAAAPPETQKQMLGERLFPLIQIHQGDLAGKITGMLLESLDQSELLVLLESPDSLNSKIGEAVSVLQAHHGNDVKSSEGVTA